MKPFLIDNADGNRIQFLIERDSPEQVVAFAEQARHCYRRASLAAKEKYGRGGAFRLQYAQGYYFHKLFLELNTRPSEETLSEEQRNG